MGGCNSADAVSVKFKTFSLLHERMNALRRPVSAGYALQLALNALQLVVTRHADEGAVESVDLDVVLQCARHAPSSMARTAALTLLAQLASALPHSTLQHVLEVRNSQSAVPFLGQFLCAVSLRSPHGNCSCETATICSTARYTLTLTSTLL